jgi:hypothetical protein
MLTENNILLSLVEAFIDNNCENITSDETYKKPFKSYLKKDDLKCFSIFDAEYSIKLVIDKDFLSTYLNQLPSYIKPDTFEGN